MAIIVPLLSIRPNEVGPTVAFARDAHFDRYITLIQVTGLSNATTYSMWHDFGNDELAANDDSIIAPALTLTSATVEWYYTIDEPLPLTGEAMFWVGMAVARSVGFKFFGWTQPRAQ